MGTWCIWKPSYLFSSFYLMIPVFSSEPPPFLSGWYSFEAYHIHFLSPLCPEHLVCHQDFPIVIALISPLLFHFLSHYLKPNLDCCNVFLSAFSVLSFPKMICGTIFLMPLPCSGRNLAFRLSHTWSKFHFSVQQLWAWGTWLNCLEPQFPHLENRGAVHRELTNVRCIG